MANIMIRQTENGGLSFYLPKRDLEASIESIEFDTPEKMGRNSSWITAAATTSTRSPSRRACRSRCAPNAWALPKTEFFTHRVFQRISSWPTIDSDMLLHCLWRLQAGLPDQIDQQRQGVLQDRRRHLYRVRRPQRHPAVRGRLPVRLYRPGLILTVCLFAPGARHVQYADRLS